MLQPQANRPAVIPTAADRYGAESHSPSLRRHRHASRPAVLVVHSRSHAVRFRILTAPSAPLPTDVPAPFLSPSLHRAQDVPESDGLQWRRNL
jgi:hypothetical protein